MEKTSNDIKLLGGWYSPFSLRVSIALNIKSLQYETIVEDLNSKSHLLLQSNPVYKKIPVLLHGDKAVCESKIIVEYIDEVWSSGPSILPSDPHDRAIARFWVAYFDDKWFEAMGKIMKVEDEEAEKQYFEEMEELAVRTEDAFEKCSKGKAFFGGDEIGLVDIVLGSLLRWVSVIEIMKGKKMLDEAKAPKLVKWAQSFCDDPNVKSVIPETEKLLEFAKALMIKWKEAAAAAN